MPRIITAIDLHVAKRLKAARMEADKSQTAAGDCIGLTFQQIQKYERGSNRLSIGRLVQLAAFYGKPVAWFFEDAPGVGSQARNGKDLAGTMLATPHGADLARAFIAFDPARRSAIVNVANAMSVQ